MFWKRRPVTNAAMLWTLVGLAALCLLVVLWRASISARSDTASIDQATAAGTQPQMPTLFGTVTSINGTKIAVDSKQPYEEIVVDARTSYRSIGGDELPSTALRSGVVLTATGVDIGERRLHASVIVILENR